MNVRLISINGSGGAFVDVNASIPCRRMEIIEDESVTPQGLDYKIPFDAFATTYDVGASTEPIQIGHFANQNGKGNVLGYPAQNTGGQSISATKIISIRSKTANTTKVRVTEYE